ncbi:hypothetical protein SAMN04515674_12118 [Pseudarcicella hirudinis]|uniref:Uncharacterized protein n=3 Tax=Pseudarcicella hirudinis TaxID=1079859 RepID=A0A1I5YRS2_9BACT|nr:hypothetical protein SAMN04515674_12118 [Pseudarcicella hirudinis]
MKFCLSGHRVERMNFDEEINLLNMKKIKLYSFLFTYLFCCAVLNAQSQQSLYWQSGTLLNPLRLFPVKIGDKAEFIDLDKDGDPDLMRYKTSNGYSVQWIDDDDDMKITDIEGDIDNDCLMVDRNNDGKYGSYDDLIVDWNDTDNDGKGDMQILTEYAREEDKNKPWGPGHVMISLDLDHDNVLNYIDWSNFTLRGWIHDGASDFYEDYHGKTLFLKIHTSPEKMNDARLNWENPFLFYDPDKDGLSEHAIRFLDTPRANKADDAFKTNLTGKISYAAVTFDADNDSRPGNEFDYDWTLNFRGEGFDYTKQKHTFKNLRGLPAADTLFMDPRYRQLSELLYPDHESAWDLIFKEGKWAQVWFTYDEDDDCQRWERVELYEPKDPYLMGAKKGGLDDNNQADPAGDRGEWDLDNSGGGKLYISPLDGKLHLYGAEKGYWRIDQNAKSFQAMGGIYDGYGPGRQTNSPETAPLIGYFDTDNNGFFDQITYDLNGDKVVDKTISISELGLSDQAPIIQSADLNYNMVKTIEEKIANNLWERSQQALKVAKSYGINSQWYALLMSPKSTRQKYHDGYWLQFYLYNDLLDIAKRQGNQSLIQRIEKAYYSGNWQKEFASN